MTAQIGRRQFIFTVGGTAVAWPVSLRAQQGKAAAHRRVVVWNPRYRPQPGGISPRSAGLGYIEAQNIVFEYRYAEGKPERLRGLAGAGRDQA